MIESARRTSAQLSGGRGEDVAAQLLEGHGLRIVARNYRTRFGEIDIVARDGDCLVFVEVRLRAHSRFGGAVESVDPRKRSRLASAAQLYLMQTRSRLACRFDVIAIDGGKTEWLRAAFSLD